MSNPDRIAEAKRLLPFPRLMHQLGHGDRAKKSARCPFHDDASNSFSMFDGDGGQPRWKCHAGCGGGDAIDFLARVRNLSNADAIREFQRLAGVMRAPTTDRAATKASASFDWSACVAAFTEQHQASLAKWRGYSPGFVAWLQSQSLVGLFDHERIAFPVQGMASNVVGAVLGCHYRRREDGSWRFAPTGTHALPLIFGQPATARTIWAFESQWDALAAMDKLGWHLSGGLPDTAVVITRGAENGKRLAGLCSSPATLVAFPQNDKPRDDGRQTPAEKWMTEIVRRAGCKVVRVATPPQFKDLNEWTLAGATTEQLQAAIAGAVPIAAESTTIATDSAAGSSLPAPDASPAAEGPDLHAAPAQEPAADTSEPSPAPFPTDALPPNMAEMIRSVARSERVPEVLPAVCALGVVSAVIGAGLEIASVGSKTTRANLFLLASAESGSGKSETFRLVAAPLLDHQRRTQDQWGQKIKPQLQSEIAVLNREIADDEKKAAKTSDHDQRKQIMARLEFRRARSEELTRQLVMPSLVAQDVTTERLIVMLQGNREVLFSTSADARKLVDNLLGRYNPGKTTDENIYLAAFSGDYTKVDRQGRESVILHKPCLSLCWFIQPDLMATMLGKESLSASGFLARLLICHTNAAPAKILGDAPGIRDTLKARWAQTIEGLLTSFHGAKTATIIQPSPEARQCIIDYHNAIVDRRLTELADVGIFAARWAEQAWRVALVIHAALHGADAGKHSLHLEVAENAVRVVEWFASQQLEILSRGRRQVQQKVEDEVFDLRAGRGTS